MHELLYKKYSLYFLLNRACTSARVQLVLWFFGQSKMYVYKYTHQPNVIYLHYIFSKCQHEHSQQSEKVWKLSKGYCLCFCSVTVCWHGIKTGHTVPKNSANFNDIASFCERNLHPLCDPYCLTIPLSGSTMTTANSHPRLSR